MPSMDPFRTTSTGGWRFTAMLGAVAIVLSAGILSWILVTVADMKSSVPSRSVDLARYYAPQSTQPQERMAERPAPSPADVRRPTQLGGSPGIASWVDDMHALGTSPFGQQAFLGPSPLEFGATPAATPPAWQPETTAQAATQSPARTALTETAPPSAVPTDHPASITPTDAAVAEVPPAAAPTPPANVAAVEAAPVEHGLPPPMAHSRRLALAHEPEVRTFRVVPTRPHKPAVAAGRPTYTEKIVEQGNSGELKFHYRRRACTPGHMVDVCYMPAENRRSIVVQRY